RACRKAYSDSDPGRGLLGLSIDRQRRAPAALVLLRAPPVDRPHLVVEPPRSTHSPTTCPRWRSVMRISKHAIAASVAGAGLTALLLSAGAMQPLKIDFSDETVGSEAKSFVSVVGVWRIEADGNNKVLVVDGRQWKEGQTAAGIADKARALYGERYAEFLDRVQAYAYFPYAVTKDVADFRDGEISVR